MNKTVFLKLTLPAIVVFTVMLFVPIPALMVDIMYAIVWALSFCVLICTIKYAHDFMTLPRVLLYLSMWILAMAIAFTRTILDGKRSVLFKYISVLNLNWIVNIVVSVVFLIGTMILVKRGVGTTTETAYNFSLETMPQRFYDVDNQLSKGQITAEQASDQKSRIQSDFDFCSNMDGISKFLAALVKSLIFLYLMSIVGGCLIEVLYNGLTVWQALVPVSFLGMWNVVLGTVPVIIFSIAGIYAIKR